VTLDSNGRDRAATPAVDRDGKKRYETPRLVDYGPVSKLTQTGGITVSDTRTRKGPNNCL
jgi:hypothetical protein